MTETLTAGPRLALDAARCDGHGICALRVPNRISLDEWGYPVVTDEPLGTRRLRRRARAAAAACPARALRLVGPGADDRRAQTGGRTGPEGT